MALARAPLAQQQDTAEISNVNLTAPDEELKIENLYEEVEEYAVLAYLAEVKAAEPRVVELLKTNKGLGLTVTGGKEYNLPIRINSIVAGGAANQHGGLKIGDELLSVNGDNVQGVTHNRAVQLMKSSRRVKLVVRTPTVRTPTVSTPTVKTPPVRTPKVWKPTERLTNS